MTGTQDMRVLLLLLQSHFDGLQDRLATFARHGVQTEAWLKGEMLMLLDRWRDAGQVTAFDREVPLPSGKKVDLTLDYFKTRHWVELKHWLIGRQKASTYNCRSYFGDASSVGILPDVQKLHTLAPGTPRWILILMTNRPQQEDWLSSIDHFNQKFAPARLTACMDIGSFPATYALGLLAVE